MRLVIRNPDSRTARRLSERLERTGLSAATLAGPAALRDPPGGEDLTLIDASEPAQAIAFAQDLRDSGLPSLAIAGICAGFAPPPSVGERLDGWVDLDGAGEPIVRRLSAIFRVGVSVAEAAERARTAEALGLSFPSSLKDHNRPPATLFVGSPCPAFLAIERAMQHWGGRLGASFTSFSAFDHIHDDRYDALVLFGGEDPAAALSLISALRRNSRLFDTPAYFLADDEQTRADALRRGADEAMRASFESENAALWLIEDIRRTRKARAVAGVLEQTLADAAQEFEFFSRHLIGISQTHHDKGRPLALAVMEVAGDARDEAAWTKGFSEIATLCSRLTRVSDSTARIDARRIALAFPSTSAAGAEAALARIGKVCECTAFAADGAGDRPLAFSWRVVELSPGESGAGLLNRALMQRAA